MLQLALTLIGTQLVLLAILRPVILWYFQLSRRTRALESIDQSLKQLPAVKASLATSRVGARRVA